MPNFRLPRSNDPQHEVLEEKWLAAEVELAWDQADRGELEEYDMRDIIDRVLPK